MVKKDNETCDIYLYDEEKVNNLIPKVNSKQIEQMALMFKVLADNTRMKIAYALSKEEELCVCDVAHIVGSSMATASHHLRLLRKMGVAKYRKEGKLVFYSLEDDHIKQLIEVAHIHIQEEKEYE